MSKTIRRLAAAFLGGLLLSTFSLIEPPARALEPAALPPAGAIRVERTICLTQVPKDCAHPVWSPDGRWIAFGRSGSSELGVVRADGTQWRTVSAEPGSGYGFAWSPDSVKIAFRSFVERDGVRMAVVKVAEIPGGRAHELHPPSRDVHPPQWSVGESGKRVSFMVGTQRVNSAWLPCSLPVTRANAGQTDSLLYYHQGNVWLCSGDGARHTALTEDGALKPVWSPDRTRFAYSQGDVLIVSHVDGKRRVRLGPGYHASWSPDGRKLVFEVNRDDGHQITSSDLYVINADGSQRTQLTATDAELEVEPCWSPDGRRIVCRDEKTGRIYLLHLRW